MKKLALLLAATILIYSTAFAEPLRWGIAVQSENNECGAFWEGDECVHYSVPEGWQALFQQWDRPGISFRGKQCSFTRGSAEKTCLCLGLKFVKDIGAKKKKTSWSTEPGTPCTMR